MDNLGSYGLDAEAVEKTRLILDSYYLNRNVYLSLWEFVKDKYDVAGTDEIPHCVPDAEDALKKTLAQGESWFLETMYLNYCLQEKRMQWSREVDRDFEWSLTKPRWVREDYPRAFEKVFNKEYGSRNLPDLIISRDFLMCAHFLRNVEFELKK